MPSVSVIIPTYNRAATCIETVESVLGQSFKDLEIIVVDDGSTDGTQEKLSKAFGHRVTYIRQENAGASVARNRGILAARGEFVAFCDSDDTLMPTHLDELVAFLREFPELGFVFADAEKFNASGTFLPSFFSGKAVGSIPTQEHPGHRLVHERSMFTDLLPGSFVPTCTLVARRSCFATAGVYDVGFRFLNDADLILRLARHFRAGHVDKVLARVRVGDDNLTAKRWTEIRFRHKLKLLRKLASEDLSPEERRAVLAQRRRTCFDFGYTLFDRGKVGEARRCLAENLFAGERVGRAWALFLATFVPPSLLRSIRRTRRALITRPATTLPLKKRDLR